MVRRISICLPVAGSRWFIPPGTCCCWLRSQCRRSLIWLRARTFFCDDVWIGVWGSYQRGRSLLSTPGWARRGTCVDGRLMFLVQEWKISLAVVDKSPRLAPHRETQILCPTVTSLNSAQRQKNLLIIYISYFTGGENVSPKSIPERCENPLVTSLDF